VDLFELIHSADRLSLAREIIKAAEKKLGSYSGPVHYLMRCREINVSF